MSFLRKIIDLCPSLGPNVAELQKIQIASIADLDAAFLMCHGVRVLIVDLDMRSLQAHKSVVQDVLTVDPGIPVYFLRTGPYVVNRDPLDAVFAAGGLQGGVLQVRKITARCLSSSLDMEPGTSFTRYAILTQNDKLACTAAQIGMHVLEIVDV